MEWYWLIATFFGLLIVFLALEVPVAFALLFINILGCLVYLKAGAGLQQMVVNIMDGLGNFNLATVPFFVLMGELLFRSDVAVRAIAIMDRLLGTLPGRLAVLSNVAGGVFGALSGSKIANTAMLGTILLPEMEERGYHPSISVGSLLSAGSLAMIIPPSSLAVIYGTVAKVSIAHLLIAGIVPGIVLVTLYALFFSGRCLINRKLAPRASQRKQSGENFALAIIKNVMPLLFIMALVLGLMFLGVATPIESSALGVIGALILASAYRKLSVDMLKKSLVGTLKATTMTFMILAGSQTFSQLMSFTGAVGGFTQALIALPVPELVTLIIMMFIVMMLGAFMDEVSIMLITIPFFMPIVAAFNWNHVWFAMLMLLNLEIAGISPPFGLQLFVMNTVAPHVGLPKIYRAAAGVMIVDVVNMALIIAVPPLVLWLPSLMK